MGSTVEGRLILPHLASIFLHLQVFEFFRKSAVFRLTEKKAIASANFYRYTYLKWNSGFALASLSPASSPNSRKLNAPGKAPVFGCGAFFGRCRLWPSAKVPHWAEWRSPCLTDYRGEITWQIQVASRIWTGVHRPLNFDSTKLVYLGLLGFSDRYYIEHPFNSRLERLLLSAVSVPAPCCATLLTVAACSFAG